MTYAADDGVNGARRSRSVGLAVEHRHNALPHPLISVGGTLDSMTPKRSATKWYSWGSSSKYIKVAFLEGKVAPSDFKKASDNLR